MSRSRELNQFYTSPKLAEYFLVKIKQVLPYEGYDIVIEPSAGTGNFYNLLDQRRLGLDLEPKTAGVIEQNFYDFLPSMSFTDAKILTIGNPPFGKKSAEAIKFFNHAARFSDAIAFILPRTFRKTSVINRLDRNFHLIFDEDVSEFSFIYENKPYDVWCCMQIWQRKNEPRPIIERKSFADVINLWRLAEPAMADFCIQRVGVRAGAVKFGPNFRTLSTQSHYFIKAIYPESLSIFQSLNYEDLKYNTAKNPSISASEFIIRFLIEYEKRQKNILND